jgi:hypothetical protein
MIKLFILGETKLGFYSKYFLICVVNYLRILLIISLIPTPNSKYKQPFAQIRSVQLMWRSDKLIKYILITPLVEEEGQKGESKMFSTVYPYVAFKYYTATRSPRHKIVDSFEQISNLQTLSKDQCMLHSALNLTNR